ncbi:MAG TPA: LuxR C-terminal-related transcriptional regulator [Chloroflexia bacterium]|nr:LuxR C-terminal-related transcriptional regulator [Chloroflexia bacterium]
MPKTALAALVWSSDQQVYQLVEQGRRSNLPLDLENTTWLEWLSGHSSFAFKGQQGHITLRKEARPHGDSYWYAYRNHEGRTLKKYLGRNSSLTLEGLEQAALTLNKLQLPNNKEDNKEEKQTINQPLAGHLLIPKLKVPRPRGNIVSREKLLKLLDNSLEGKVTLLSAPAGFGKTTLVSSWISRRGPEIPPAGWVALDSGDNDPFRFWHYLIAACQTFEPNLGQQSLKLLQTPRQPPFQGRFLDMAVTTLLNELVQYRGRGIIVLEDYHVITSPEIHRTIAYLIEHLPATFHLILITRSDPPLPLARLRAHNEMVELGAAHLRFSLEETDSFLHQTLAFELNRNSVDRLQSRTEGWATGLRLITLALQSQLHEPEQEVEEILATISGSQRHILEYLVADVLSAQPVYLQEFLLQTTSLTRLTGSLCEAVTGRKDSAILLKELERANLFIVPLDGEGHWYRYHALFAEAMQHEAQRRLGEETLQDYASKASRWYEEQGLYTEAVEAALSAREVERSARLISELLETQNLNELTQFHTLMRWLQQIPDETLRHYPMLCQVYALILLFTGEKPTLALWRKIEPYILITEDIFRASGNNARLGEILSLHALAIGQINDIEGAFRYAREAIDLLPETERFWRSSNLLLIGMEKFFSGHFYEAHNLLQKARALIEAEGNIYAIRACYIISGLFHSRQGKLQQAYELLRFARDNAGEDRFDLASALVGLAGLDYEWNRLEAAQQAAQEAYNLSKDFGNELLLLQTTVLSARLLNLSGKTDQAQQMLHSLTVHITQPLLLREAETWQIKLALMSGDSESAALWLRGRQSVVAVKAVSEMQQEEESLIAARLLLLEGEIEQALELLDTALTKALSQGRIASQIELLVLKAKACYASKRLQKAETPMKEALKLARSEGFQRLFLDEGESLIPLLKAQLVVTEGKPMTAYIGSLLQELTRSQVAEAATALSDYPLLEELTPQEKRVLRLLTGGRTNPEIARELVVSVNTVKAQVKSIYRKLDVTSRIEATEVARRLQLL